MTVTKIPGTYFVGEVSFLSEALMLIANQASFPGMVDNLIHRTLAWEDEKKKLFLYDGVSFLSVCSLGYSPCQLR